MKASFSAMAMVLLFAAATTVSAQTAAKRDLAALEVFEQRIMPIFNSPQPSSCVQCHLAAVDLKNYILPSHEKTFVSMRDQGLIDLEQPEKSKILELIQMGEKDLDEGAKLIHADTRQAEYDALAAWVKACCNDPRLRDLPRLSEEERAGPRAADPVIRHARKSRVVDSFVRNVWSQRMRCFPCHTPHEIDPSNPKHEKPRKNQKEFVEKFGTRMNIFHKTPQETLNYLIEASKKPPQNGFPLINLLEPRNSLIVLKPTSKLPRRGSDKRFEEPSSKTPVSHMGGLKMHCDDQSYKAFIAWLEDYANVVGDRYASVEELPADNWHPTNFVLKVGRTPKSWTKGVPVQLFLYARNKSENNWQSEPFAFTQGTVTPRRRVNGALILLRPNHSDSSTGYGDKPDRPFDPHAAMPTSGTFLIKAYVDSKHRLAKDPTVLLGNEDFVGQAELQVDKWQEGFRPGPLVSAQLFQKDVQKE